MFARKSNFFLMFIALNLAVFFSLFVHAHFKVEGAGPAVLAKKALVERLELTDLCLFTDARYTRNPTMADRQSPFQDSPMAMEHFPSGAIMPPPPHLRRP